MAEHVNLGRLRSRRDLFLPVSGCGCAADSEIRAELASCAKVKDSVEKVGARLIFTQLE